jgi:hypothetical protein
MSLDTGAFHFTSGYFSSSSTSKDIAADVKAFDILAQLKSVSVVTGTLESIAANP